MSRRITVVRSSTSRASKSNGSLLLILYTLVVALINPKEG